MTGNAQMPLAFDHPAAMAADDFLVVPGNRDAVAWLERWPAWPSTALVVHGPRGCGKTHLARVFMAHTGARAITPAQLASPSTSPPADDAPAFVVEDADDVLRPEVEEGLLHLYNQVREGGRHLLVTAATPPARWELTLADLRSRMNTAVSVAIGAPDDRLMAAVLVKLFGDRQLRVADDVISFILVRMERTFAAAQQIVSAIDATALASRRSIAVPLVRRVMDDLAAAGEKGED